ncbi:MAG: conjugal transfer protein TraF [bacterium]|nr:conjugal transfer protein TraF [bacterium]
MKKVSLFLLFLASNLYPIVGARPMGMGGAFIAVADDVNSCYWNPAGLADVTHSQATYMEALNNEDDEACESQRFLASSWKIRKGEGGGISYLDTKKWLSTVEIDDKKIWLVASDRWVTVSVGGYGERRLMNTAFGLNLRRYSSSLMQSSGIMRGGAKFDDLKKQASAIGIDIGAMYKPNKGLKFGLVLTDINEPKLEFPDININGKRVSLSHRYPTNIRLGVGFKPDEETTFALDLFNFDINDWYAEGDSDQSSFRVGFERWVEKSIALRCGLYGDSKTCGIGFRKRTKPFDLEIDAALISKKEKGFYLLSSSLKYY